MKHTTHFDDDGWLTRYDDKPVMQLSVLPKFDLLRKPVSRLCINLKGCNGSGKSTVPMELLASAKTSLYIAAEKGDKKPCGVYVPELRTVIIGLYSPEVNCGGCDALGDTQIVKRLLIKLWKRDVHIIFEGVIVGDIRSTFHELMLKFNEVHKRQTSFCFMGTKLKTCFRRIQSRNGGKPINEELVRQKYRNSCVQLKWYLEQGTVDCKVLNTTGSKREVFDRFMGMYPRLKA